MAVINKSSLSWGWNRMGHYHFLIYCLLNNQMEHWEEQCIVNQLTHFYTQNLSHHHPAQKTSYANFTPQNNSEHLTRRTNPLKRDVFAQWVLCSRGSLCHRQSWETETFQVRGRGYQRGLGGGSNAILQHSYKPAVVSTTLKRH